MSFLLNNVLYAQLLKSRGYEKLANKILTESYEEWEEVKQANDKLVELDIIPIVEIQKISSY